MKRRPFFCHAFRAAALLFLLGTGGCVTMETREDQVQQQQQEQSAQQNMDRLKAQVESLLAQQDQLQQQIQQLRATTQDRATTSDLQSLQSQTQSRIAELDRKIAALDAARAQDRQEIVSTLSKNMAAAMAQNSRSPSSSSHGGTRPSGGAATPHPSGGTPQKFHEHPVAAGDTLSAIAAAYHVTPGAIIAANNLTNPQNLKVGQKLLIPAQ